MKKSIYKPGTLLLLATFLFSFTLSAQEVTKEYHKEYKADKTTTLDISNKYGDIIIESWDKDQVVIDVKVTVDVYSKDRAEKLLDLINVEFTEGANRISAKTMIDDRFNFSGWGDNKRFSIDYNIKMPIVTNLTLENKYGDTEINKLESLVNINIKYGNLTAAEFTRGNEKPINTISIAYGKGSIGEAGWLDIYTRYCRSLEIEKSQALLIDSKYSTFNIGTTSSIVGESKYDNIDIEKINNFVLVSGYTETNIAEITKKLSLQGNYGSFSAEQIPSGFESIDIDVRYLGVRLGIDESASYSIEGESSYGEIKFNEDKFRYQRHIVENNNSEITGVVGDEKSPESKVKILSTYCTVRLY